MVNVFHTAISYWLINLPLGAGKEDGGPGHPHGVSALLVNVFHTVEGEVNTTRATRELIIFLKQYVIYRMQYSMQYVQTGIYSQEE